MGKKKNKHNPLLQWGKATIHWAGYIMYLFGMMIRESVLMAVDVYTGGRHIAPVVVYYPLRLNTEKEIAYFITSIIMTPGTLALGITGSKEVDFDAAMGERDFNNVNAASSHLEDTHGVSRVNRFLAVHAVYGESPLEILEGLADIEEHLNPEVKKQKQYFDVDHLVERGVQGSRGYSGTRGGRATDSTPFSIERVDSTPHDAAVNFTIARQLEVEEEELKHEVQAQVEEGNTEAAISINDDAVIDRDLAQAVQAQAEYDVHHAKSEEEKATREAIKDSADSPDFVDPEPPAGNSDPVQNAINQLIQAAQTEEENREDEGLA